MLSSIWQCGSLDSLAAQRRTRDQEVARSNLTHCAAVYKRGKATCAHVPLVTKQRNLVLVEGHVKTVAWAALAFLNF